MTKTLCSLALAAGLLSARWPPQPSGRTLLVREHRTTLESFRAAQVRGYLEGNPQAMLVHLADSVRLMPGYQKTVLGKADAATYHQAFLKRFKVSAYERQAIEAVDLGSRVMEIGHFTMTLVRKRHSGSAHAGRQIHGPVGKDFDRQARAAYGGVELRSASKNRRPAPVCGGSVGAHGAAGARAGQRRHQPRIGRALQAAGIGDRPARREDLGTVLCGRCHPARQSRRRRVRAQGVG